MSELNHLANYIAKVKRGAFYLRISKSDGSQTVENQRMVLKKFAESKGIEIVQVFEDEATGSNSDREGFREMLQAAERGEFDVLVVSAIDRLSREGIGNLSGYLGRLRRAGVSIISNSEKWFDTSSENPTSELLISIFAWVAKQERIRLIERTRAGLDRARAEGKKLGRPMGKKDAPGLKRSSHRYYKSFNPKRAKKALNEWSN